MCACIAVLQRLRGSLVTTSESDNSKAHTYYATTKKGRGKSDRGKGIFILEPCLVFTTCQYEVRAHAYRDITLYLGTGENMRI